MLDALHSKLYGLNYIYLVQLSDRTRKLSKRALAKGCLSLSLSFISPVSRSICPLSLPLFVSFSLSSSFSFSHSLNGPLALAYYNALLFDVRATKMEIVNAFSSLRSATVLFFNFQGTTSYSTALYTLCGVKRRMNTPKENETEAEGERERARKKKL